MVFAEEASSSTRTLPVFVERASKATPTTGAFSFGFSLRSFPAVDERVSLSPVEMLALLVVAAAILKLPVMTMFKYSPGLMVVGSALTGADSSRVKSDKSGSARPTITLSYSFSVAAATVTVGCSPTTASVAPVQYTTSP